MSGAAGESDDDRDRARGGSRSSAPPDHRPPTRVLVVDDDELLRTTIQRVLRIRGIDAMTAASGAAALQALATDDFDVVLADIRMPTMSGLEFIARARAASRDVEVILMTAFPDPESRRLAADAGAFGLLPKPFVSNESVVRELESAAAHRRARHGS